MSKFFIPQASTLVESSNYQIEIDDVSYELESITINNDATLLAEGYAYASVAVKQPGLDQINFNVITNAFAVKLNLVEDFFNDKKQKHPSQTYINYIRNHYNPSISTNDERVQKSIDILNKRIKDANVAAAVEPYISAEFDKKAIVERIIQEKSNDFETVTYSEESLIPRTNIIYGDVVEAGQPIEEHTIESTVYDATVNPAPMSEAEVAQVNLEKAMSEAAADNELNPASQLLT